MLSVKLNRHQFEYDIHSLVKAFYSETPVKVFVEGEKEAEAEENYPFLIIKMEEDSIQFSILPSNSKLEENNAILHVKSVSPSICFETGTGRSHYKNELKKLIYTGLSDYTKKGLPWGTLTGIRPTKIPMTFLEEGKEKEEILEYMKETYFISDEKGQLAIEIAQREKDLLSRIHYEDGYSLYIGIPFCPTTCLYCSFTSYPISAWKQKVEEYLDAMEKEIDYVSKACKDKILDSVYIGGGTPTTLEPEQLERLLSKLKASFDFTEVKEFTVEAGRADSITRAKLEVLKKHQVTRISVNPQTMKEDTLRLIGRQAKASEVIEAFGLARELGFDNINMDLILGLPEEDKEDVIATIEAVKQLNPDSLTVHSLAVKRASKMNQWIEENGIQTLKNTDETMEIANMGARELGMVPYYLYRQKNMSGNFENVGYAKEGKFGIYNILIMEEKQSIMAIGAGSISKVVYPDGRIERCDSIKDVALYIEKIDEMIERKRKLWSNV